MSGTNLGVRSVEWGDPLKGVALFLFSLRLKLGEPPLRPAQGSGLSMRLRLVVPSNSKDGAWFVTVTGRVSFWVVDPLVAGTLRE